MHNQRRDEYKARLRDPKASAVIAQKAYQYKTLSKELLSRRLKQREPNIDAAPSSAKDEGEAAAPAAVAETLKLTEKILTVNPDPGHLWNHRRELLLLPSSSTQPTSESLFDMHNELTLTAKCLERNPKAYGAWHHRKWSIRHHLLSETSAASGTASTTGDRARESAGGGGEENKERAKQFLPLLQSELDLCCQFLTHDERNFHCWNYRRFVVSALGWCHVVQQQSKVQQGQQTETLLDGSWNWIGFGIGANEAIMGPQLASSVDDECQGEVGDGGGEGGDSSGNNDDDSLLDQLLETEWDFTTHKIASNFSNGSAFHHRSKLLPLMLDVRCKDRARDAAAATADGVVEEDEDTKEELDEIRIEEIIEECYDEALDLARVELDLIRNATFTEPDDQTPWWYHRFVVAWCHPTVALSSWGQSGGIVTSAMIESYVELLHDEIESVRELIDAEEQCKWGRLALHMLLTTLTDNGGSNGGTRASKEQGYEEDDEKEDDEEDEGNDHEWMIEEANECLDELVKMDPDRIVRYESMRRRR